MKKRLLLAVLLLAALLGVLAVFDWGDRGDRGEVVEAAGLPDTTPATEAPRDTGDLLAPTRLATPATETSTTREASVPVVTERVDPWAEDLAGLHGRVVEADGAPVPNLRVALLEADTMTLLAGDLERLGESVAGLVRDEVRTDDEGRFRFAGARGGAFHGLGLDLGGARGALRILEHALVNGEDTDVGDIVLAASGILRGRVVDETGEPVAGARVRVAALPDDILEVNVYDLRPGTRFAFGGRQVFELPQRLGLLLDILPVPTAYTDREGRFRLEGVPLDAVLGGVDKVGWLGTAIEPLAAVGGEQDLGDLVLRHGRAPRGSVVDARGRPVADAEVCLGVLGRVGVALLQPVGTSDAEGRFQGAGLPLEGPVVAAARRSALEPWTLAVAEEGEPRVELPEAVPLTVHVHDLSGKPVGGARLDVRAVEDSRGFMAEMLTGIVGRPDAARTESREVEPGVHRIEALAVGAYDVTATVPGLAPATERVEVAAPGGELTLTLNAGRSIPLRVVDAVSREPVEHARVSLVTFDRDMPRTAALAWTDAAGEALLGPYSASGESGRFGRGVLVEEPRYPNTVVPLEGDPPSLLVELAPGGAIEGRIHWGGATPEQRYMVMTMPDMGILMGFFSLPRWTLSDEAGAFRFEGFAAGEYDLTVYERYFDGDPIAILRDELEPRQVFTTTVEVMPGETARVDVDLNPGGRGQVGRVVGRVRENGVPFAGARVTLQGPLDAEVRTDASGSFTLEDVPAIQGSRLTIRADVRLPDGSTKEAEVYGDWFRLEPGEEHRVDVDVAPQEIPVEVFDEATGEPIEHAAVQLQSPGGLTNMGKEVPMTDTSGRARVLALASGASSLEVSAAGHVTRHVSLELPRSDPMEPVRVELGEALPCSGRIVVVEEPPGEQAWVYLMVSSPRGGPSASTQVDEDTLEFSLEGLTAGHYRADIWMNGSSGEPVEFDLGPDGTRDLTLEFVPAREE